MQNVNSVQHRYPNLTDKIVFCFLEMSFQFQMCETAINEQEESLDKVNRLIYTLQKNHIINYNQKFAVLIFIANMTKKIFFCKHLSKCLRSGARNHTNKMQFDRPRYILYIPKWRLAPKIYEYINKNTLSVY